MFLDLQFPFGRITFFPFTVTLEIGTGDISLQHWQWELEHADVPPNGCIHFYYSDRNKKIYNSSR